MTNETLQEIEDAVRYEYWNKIEAQATTWVPAMVARIRELEAEVERLEGDEPEHLTADEAGLRGFP